MAISNKTKDQLKKLNINVDELIKAIQSKDEIDIDLPNGTFFTDDELRQRDEAKVREAKEAGVEMAVKELKRANNLEFAGKSIDALYKYLSEKSNQPSEVEEGLRKNLTKLESEKLELSKKLSEMNIMQSVSSILPKNLAMPLTPSEAIALMNANGYSFTEKDGNVQVLKNGKAIKDEKLLTELPINAAIEGFFKEKNLLQAEGGNNGQPIKGMGGNNMPANGSKSFPKSIKEIEQEWTAQGKNINGVEYNTHLSTILKEAKESGHEINMNG